VLTEGSGQAGTRRRGIVDDGRRRRRSVFMGRAAAEGLRASGLHGQVQHRAGKPGKRSAQPEERRW
jgi:hypothetical protein